MMAWKNIQLRNSSGNLGSAASASSSGLETLRACSDRRTAKTLTSRARSPIRLNPKNALNSLRLWELSGKILPAVKHVAAGTLRVNDEARELLQHRQILPWRQI